MLLMGASAVSGDNWVTTLDPHGRRPIHYQSTTGLRDDDVDELAGRIGEVLETRGQSLSGYCLGLRQQVELTLVLARHNISQALSADMYGISQSTVSRVGRRMVPLVTHVLAMTGMSLAQAVTQGGLLLVDGTPIPTGNNPAAGRPIEKAN